MQLQYFDVQLIGLFFIAMKLEENGNVHNLDMWQRAQPIAWRDIKKSLDRRESSGNAFIWTTLVSWPVLFVYEWHLPGRHDMN